MGNPQSENGNLKPADSVLDENEILEKPEPLRIVWFSVFKFSLMHIFACLGLYQVISGQAKRETNIWAILFYIMSTIGSGVGAHRYWSHRSFKAKLPLRILLIIFQTIAFQNSAYEWARDHRVHHKYSETHADPHNAKRGFFFAHMGWLLCKKHSAVIIKGQKIDLSDLHNDGVVMFQKRYYLRLCFTLSIILPTLIPWYFWGESLSLSFFSTILRYVLSLHAIWNINSFAHLFGNHPYDKHINPSESKGVSILNFGEGWHNYHHTFPWDYKAGEFGFYNYNINAGFIYFFSKLGLAYDLKTASKNMIEARVKKTGDGSHEKFQQIRENLY